MPLVASEEDEISINHHHLVEKDPATTFHICLENIVGGESHTFNEPKSGEHERSAAYCGDRLVFLEETSEMVSLSTLRKIAVI